jgi:hypothetical protein
MKLHLMSHSVHLGRRILWLHLAQMSESWSHQLRPSSVGVSEFTSHPQKLLESMVCSEVTPDHAKPHHSVPVRRNPSLPPVKCPTHMHALIYLSMVPTGDPSPGAQSWLQGWGSATTSSGWSLLSKRRSWICLWMSSCSLHICSCSSLITFRTDCGKEEKGEKSTGGQLAHWYTTP